MTEPDSPSMSNSNSSVHEPSHNAPLRSLLDDLPPNPAVSSSPFTPGPKRLHIANIPYKWVESDLQQLFAPFGAVTQIEVVCNERGSKGFGFVTFLDATAADVAVAALTGRIVQGRTLAVNEASRRRRTLLPDPSRGTAHWQQSATTTNHGNEQGTADFGALLLKQKQLLAQQQLQQFLVTQQQSDMIATALGLPTSNLGGLLAGSLQYPAAGMAGLTMDPHLALQLQSLQHQQLLQPVTAMQQYAAYGQVPSSYGMPMGAMGPVKSEAGQQQHHQLQHSQQSPHNNHPVDMYIANEMTHSSSSTSKGRSTTHNGQRFNPY